MNKLEAEVYEAEMDEDDDEEVASMEEALEDMVKEGEKIEKSYGEDEIGKSYGEDEIVEK